MSTKKFFVGAGALVLTFAAVFAGKPRNSITTVYSTTNGLSSSCKQVLTGGTNIFTTGNTSLNQATIVSVGGTARKLYGTAGCTTKKAFYHPV